MKISIIPARGGSQRIPRKNIKNFMGKPIIAYSIECALRSELFDKIIVSTDDDEIAECAIKYGAEVPFIRPAELADAYSGTNAVVKHALEWFTLQDIQFDYACCIYATAPLLKEEYLRDGISLLVGTDYDFAFSVTKYPAPIQRSIKINSAGEIEANWPENIPRRSQDLSENFHDAGQFYWGKAPAFINQEPLFSNRSLPVVLPRYLVQDIDTAEDWIFAEHIYRSIQSIENENCNQS